MSGSLVTLVGELNPYGSDPSMALYHLPYGASGDRLRRILGLREETYGALNRMNLCTGKWDTKQARYHADDFKRTRTPDEIVVLLGAKVRAAFGLQNFAFFSGFYAEECSYLCLPHPSGRNTVWLDPTNAPRARKLLHEMCDSVPWGELP